VALVGIVLLSLALRVHIARECSLWLDEIATRVAASRPWKEVLAGPTRGHLPLMYVLVRVTTDLVGTSEIGLRAVSLFFGCLLLIAMHELCLELGLSAGRSLLVVATFALSPFFIRHATEARHYAILCTFSTLATTRALRLLREPRRWIDLVGFAVGIVGTAATHYFGLAYALALFGAVAFGFALAWRRAHVRWRVAGIVVLLACVWPLWRVLTSAVRVGDSFGVSGPGEGTINVELVREILHEFSLLDSEAWWLALGPIFAVTGLILLSRRLTGIARLFPLGLGIAPCVISVFVSSRHFLSARYLAPSAVWYHLGGCVALFALAEQLRPVLSRHQRLATLVPVADSLLLATLAAARLFEYPTRFGVGLDDYRGLQVYFKEHLARDTALVTFPENVGRMIFGEQYWVGRRPIGLERFRPVRGINRYLVAELHSNSDVRQAKLEAAVLQNLGLSQREWRALPHISLPQSPYQRAVPARIVELPSGWKPPRREKRRRKGRAFTATVSER